MNRKEWTNRITRRSDFTCGIVHLTKPTENNSGFEILMKILREKVIISSTRGYICGTDPVVCFQDVPLQSLSENVYYEQNLAKENNENTRYSAYGIRFSKTDIYRAGGRPVIYDNTCDAKKYLKNDQYWRIVCFDLNKDKNMIDWTHEREWRIKGDYNFEWNQVEVLLSDETSFNKFYNYCLEHKLTDMLNEIKGVIHLKSMIF